MQFRISTIIHQLMSLRDKFNKIKLTKYEKIIYAGVCLHTVYFSGNLDTY